MVSETNETLINETKYFFDKNEQKQIENTLLIHFKFKNDIELKALLTV